MKREVRWKVDARTCGFLYIGSGGLSDSSLGLEGAGKVFDKLKTTEETGKTLKRHSL